MAKASRGKKHIRLHLAGSNRCHGVTASDLVGIAEGEEVGAALQ